MYSLFLWDLIIYVMKSALNARFLSNTNRIVFVLEGTTLTWKSTRETKKRNVMYFFGIHENNDTRCFYLALHIYIMHVCNALRECVTHAILFVIKNVWWLWSTCSSPIKVLWYITYVIVSKTYTQYNLSFYA